MRIVTRQFSIFALGLACLSGEAQKTNPVGVDKGSSAAVRLEAHEGQTAFKLGDPVVLDLIFKSGSPGYVIDTNTTPYLPASDIVMVTPDHGWLRTHSAFTGQSIDGTASMDLGGDPVRVPVLLNRTITFQKPGHYQVTLTTERLRSAETLMEIPTLGTGDPCCTTNAVGIDIGARDEREEAELVGSLSQELGDYREPEPGDGISPKEKEELLRESEAVRKGAGSRDEGNKESEALLWKMNEAWAKAEAFIQKRQAEHREAAVRLSCLGGDDAIRAKVHFIVADAGNSGGNPIGPIMVDGLPSSRNFELQESLLEAAWRDPLRVPTSELQGALRQAEELLHQGVVSNEPVLWAPITPEQLAVLDEYERELNEIAVTLPERTEANREQTAAFLKMFSRP